MKILLADDHPLFREGVKPLLRKLDTSVQIIEAKDYPSALQAASQVVDLDLALLDLYMPGMPGEEGISRFRSAYPAVPVVVLSASEQTEDIQHLLAAGALGYITKASPSEVILNALRLVLAGGIYVPPTLIIHKDEDAELEAIANYVPLTLRQLQVLRQLASGKTNRQIAQSLNVTEGTIKIHLATIFRALKVNNRSEALLVAQKLGIGLLAKPDTHAS